MTIRPTCRRIPLSSHDLALPRRVVIPIPKTQSAVLGESIAGQPSDMRGEIEGFHCTRADTTSIWELYRCALVLGIDCLTCKGPALDLLGTMSGDPRQH